MTTVSELPTAATTTACGYLSEVETPVKLYHGLVAPLNDRPLRRHVDQTTKQFPSSGTAGGRWKLNLMGRRTKQGTSPWRPRALDRERTAVVVPSDVQSGGPEHGNDTGAQADPTPKDRR